MTTRYFITFTLWGSAAVPTKTTASPPRRFEKLNAWAEHAARIGCTAIYIGPLFESGSHGYDTIDYRRVDRRLGTNEEFKEFVAGCHARGQKVIVDGVFNHVGRDFFAFQDLKANRENARYKDWFCDVNFWGNNEYNDGFSYGNWGGFNLLVKLNQRNPEVQNYHFDTIRFWVDEFDSDGIRLDAADVLDFDFMKGLRRLANEVKPEFWLMGEVIHGDYSRWANPEMLHSVTNYELHKGLWSGHNDHNYFEIAHTMRRLQGLCHDTKLYLFSDNHDVERLPNKLRNKEHIRLAEMQRSARRTSYMYSSRMRFWLSCWNASAVGGVVGVFVAEQFIGNFTRQQHADVSLLVDGLAQQVHAHAGADGGDIPCAQQPDDLFEAVDDHVPVDDDLVVLAAEVLGGLAGVLQVDGVGVHADGEGPDGLPSLAAMEQTIVAPADEVLHLEANAICGWT